VLPLGPAGPGDASLPDEDLPYPSPQATSP